MTSDSGARVRVRFSPSPTGNPHVGLARTALFNWAFARHVGADFVFRIEDTDAARDSEESYNAVVDALKWLGFDWDEGPDIGGPYAPYRQSQRREIYADVIRQLVDAGYAYESFTTPEETEARHLAAGRDKKLGYDNFDRDLTDEQKAAYRAEGRQPVLRIRMPDEDLTVTDLIRGEVTWKAGSVTDYVIVRANGEPLYPLVNPVDDALMEISHILRGEDLLPSTPRQLVLHRALVELGISKGVPEFGHLPYVMGQGNKKLSKRDPEAHLLGYRDRGFIPEGLLNYLALLGWSIADDRDVFSMEEMVQAFDLSTVNSNPARFDLAKCEAINATHLRALPLDDFTQRLTGYFVSAGLVSSPPSPEESRLIAAGAPLVQERVVVLGDGVRMLAFLFTPDADFTPDEDSAAKTLGPDADPVLNAAIDALSDLSTWDTESIEAALKAALVDGLGLKPRKAFAPVRVAITGRTVSPPLYESMELLGRDRSIGRLRATLTA